MSKYNNNVEDTSSIPNIKTSNWNSINPEYRSSYEITKSI